MAFKRDSCSGRQKLGKAIGNGKGMEWKVNWVGFVPRDHWKLGQQEDERRKEQKEERKRITLATGYSP
jgi:hypothetical protein